MYHVSQSYDAVPTPAPALSLCMIVRDNQKTIEPCLASIRPWVDEMIVVDTGSTDETPNIAARQGARVFSFPWVDDFSAARNESLRHARGKWLFWITEAKNASIGLRALCVLLFKCDRALPAGRIRNRRSPRTR